MCFKVNSIHCFYSSKGMSLKLFQSLSKNRQINVGWDVFSKALSFALDKIGIPSIMLLRHTILNLKDYLVISILVSHGQDMNKVKEEVY